MGSNHIEVTYIIMLGLFLRRILSIIDVVSDSIMGDYSRRRDVLTVIT